MSDKTVFISYRRNAIGNPFAGRIHDALKRNGYDSFLDVYNISSGNWKQKILAEVPRHSHFILVLTPGSLDRCSDVGDWVRHEYTLAKKSGRNIVPIFEENVDKKLLKDTCPRSMQTLFDYNGIELRHNSFENDINRLVSEFIPPHKAPAQLSKDSEHSVHSQSVKEVDKEVAGLNLSHSGTLKFLKFFAPHILTLIVLAVCMLTLWQGVKGNWNLALLIPIVFGAKGFSLVFDLPSEVRGIAILALFAIVCGLFIIVGKAKREWQEGIWLAGLTSLAYGLGMATALALTKTVLLRNKNIL